MFGSINGKENVAPLDENTINSIIKDINRFYFQDAVPDNPARNQGFAREIIVRYGTKLPIEGFAFAVIRDYLRLQPNFMALTNALNNAVNLYNYAFDFVCARGNTEAGYVLAAIINTSADEDVCAFAALTFASPHFVNAFGKNTLLESLRRSEGTSCLMALALALYQCGEDQQLNMFIREGYIPNYLSTGNNSDYDQEEVRNGIASIYAPIILKVLFEDIATNGKGFSRSLNPSSKPWYRKQNY